MPPKSYLKRILEKEAIPSLEYFPVTAILGPRQCGKSTLVKHLLTEYEDTLFLDLEKDSDLEKLSDPEWFLGSRREKLICLDEIQRKPELFPLLRSLIDEDRRPGMYLILGSASRELIRQSSESLAGRISYHSLTPFLWDEVKEYTTIENYMAKGGFPLSLLTDSEKFSYDWRKNFITTFLERDLLQYAGFTPRTMRRLWQMLAHSNGQTVNYSSLGSSLGVSHTTIRNYLDLLEGTFMVYQVPPFEGNTKKRLIKAPKVYIADSGISLALLNLKNFEAAAGHPSFGALWETVVLSNLNGHFPRLDVMFYRTNHGIEIDFAVSDGTQTVAIECKASVSPKVTKGNYQAIEDIQPELTLVVSPIKQGYRMNPKMEIVSLEEMVERLTLVFG